MSLVGATRAFVRRPFLYAGIFYGMMGGIVAWLLLDFFVLWLREPLLHVFQLYAATIHLQELDITTLFLLIFAGSVLGGIGSLGSVSYFLRRQEREMLL